MVQETITSEETQTEPSATTPAAVAEGLLTTGAETEQVTGPAEGETPPPPWATVADPYDVLNLDEFKPHLERRIARERETLDTQLKAEYAQKTSDWESTNVHNTIAGYVGTIDQKLDLGDYDGAEKILAKLEKFRDPYTAPYQERLRGEGAAFKVNEVINALASRLNPRGQDELKDIVRTAKNWDDVLKKYDDFRSEKDYARGLKEGEAALAAKLKAQAEGGPVVAAVKGGGAGDDNKRLLDPTTPIEEIMQIRARQRAGS